MRAYAPIMLDIRVVLMCVVNVTMRIKANKFQLQSIPNVSVFQVFSFKLVGQETYNLNHSFFVFFLG